MLHGATGSQLEKLWDVVEKGEENNGAEVEEAVVTLNKLSFTLVPSSPSFFVHANPSCCY